MPFMTRLTMVIYLGSVLSVIFFLKSFNCLSIVIAVDDALDIECEAKLSPESKV